MLTASALPGGRAAAPAAPRPARLQRNDDELPSTSSKRFGEGRGRTDTRAVEDLDMRRRAYWSRHGCAPRPPPDTAPNSPATRAVQRESRAVTRVPTMPGSVTLRRNIWAPAGSRRAGARRLPRCARPRASIAGIGSRATSGTVTKRRREHDARHGENLLHRARQTRAPRRASRAVPGRRRSIAPRDRRRHRQRQVR